MNARVVPVETTLARVREVQSRFGVTRVGELTYLDRLGIPVMTAIVPKSSDDLGVYNGKGLTREAAVASALMEALERQAAAAFEAPSRYVPARDIELNLDALGLFPSLRDESLECVQGFELETMRPLWVPIALVRCPWKGTPSFPASSTNGLAAGNTRTEAVYHALMELIERHVWSLTHVKVEMMPRLLFGSGYVHSARMLDRLTLQCGHAHIDTLAQRVQRAGMQLRVLVMRERGLPVTMLATIAETSSTLPMVSVGLGTSWSPAHAVIRAITEAAQSRLVDIQGAREDIERRIAGTLPSGKWFFDGPAASIALDEVPDRSSGDLQCDVTQTIRAVKACGVRTIAGVDLSPTWCSFFVVRVVAAEFETYCVDRRIGPAARALLALGGLM